MKLIWLSDLHFEASGDVLGHDPRARMGAAIDHINAHHGDAAYCVVSGDLVDTATPENYAAVARMLDRLAVPLLPMVGNHDDRDLMAAHFTVPQGLDGFVQYAVEATDADVLCLDTLVPGQGHGSLCPARLDWLDSALAQTPDKPALIFMHHPPIPLGSPMLDDSRVVEGDAFMSLLARHRNRAAYLCTGHVHRPITGVARGVPFATMRSVLYQAPPPEPAWDWDSFAPAPEAPQLGVLTVSGGWVTLQYEQFCEYALGVTSGG